MKTCGVAFLGIDVLSMEVVDLLVLLPHVIDCFGMIIRSCPFLFINTLVVCILDVSTSSSHCILLKIGFTWYQLVISILPFNI